MLRLSRDTGHGRLLGAALGLVALRVGLAAWSQVPWAVGLAQVMEGAAMGLAGVAIPALVAGCMNRSGHANAELGGVLMADGAGAALSPLVAGLAAQHGGFVFGRRDAAIDEPDRAASRAAAP